jgi:hypothetical protein
MRTNTDILFSAREKAVLTGGMSLLLALCLAGSALVYQTAFQKVNQSRSEETRNTLTGNASATPLASASSEGNTSTSSPVVKISAIVEKDGKRVVGWTGSGVIVSKEGLVLTSAQVVRPGKPFPIVDLLVSMPSAPDQPLADAYYADVIQASVALDIAVIQIVRDNQQQPVDKATLHLPTASFADSDLLQPGDALTISGISPDGLLVQRANQVTGFQQEAGVSLRAFLRLSASEAGSYSGSAVLDSDGRLVGIATGMDAAFRASQSACSKSIDTNRDGAVDALDRCTPASSVIQAARPIRLVQSLLAAAQRGIVHIDQERAAQITLPAAGRILFADPFQDANSGWPMQTPSSIRDGKLQLVVPEGYTVRTAGLAQPFADVRVDVTITVDASSGDGDYGALCRYTDTNNYYALEISEDGYYSIWKKSGGIMSPLVDWTGTDALTPGASPGRVTFTCIGSTLAIVQNGKLIGQATDTSLATGGIGLVAGTWENGGLSVSFSSLTVRSAGNQPERPLEVLFQDDFSVPQESWWDLTRGGAFFNSGMRIQVNVRQKDLYVRSYQVFSNVRMEVDATPIGGPDDNDYGLICRYQEATHEFYYFEITADGKYQIGYYSAGGTQVALSNAQFKSSSTILPGRGLNHLRADCDGTSLVLFVNGTQVALVEDERLRDGGVGMIAGTWDTPGTDIQFDNFYVYKP